MRKTMIAASAAAVLALSAACGSDEAADVADSAGDVAASATAAAGDAAASATEEGGDGANGEGAGANGGDTEMAPLTLPDGSEQQVPAGIAEKHEEIQGNSGHLGAPVGEAQAVAGGQMLEFEGGTLVQNPDGEAFLVQGEILKEYTANGGPEGELGFPTSDEEPTETGFISTFENGEITFDLSTEESTVTQN